MTAHRPIGHNAAASCDSYGCWGRCTDDALLLSGDLEDFGRFYDRYVKALLAFFQQRDAIRAHVLDDRDYAEIAQSQRLTEATVRKRVSRGLRVLRDRAGGIR